MNGKWTETIIFKKINQEIEFIMKVEIIRVDTVSPKK